MGTATPSVGGDLFDDASYDFDAFEYRLADPFGPQYPALPGAAKYRRLASKAGSVAEMDAADREAYGQSVLTGVLELQQRECARVISTNYPCPCASGTYHSDGEKILAAVRSQNRSRK